MLEHFPYVNIILRMLAPCRGSIIEVSQKKNTHTYSISPALCSFPSSSWYLILIMFCLFLSMSSTVSLTHQFPSFIRQQSLVNQSLERVCFFTAAPEIHLNNVILAVMSNMCSVIVLNGFYPTLSGQEL